MKKFLSIFLAAALGAAVLTGCGGNTGSAPAPQGGGAAPSAAGEKTHLKFMGWGNDAEVATF